MDDPLLRKPITSVAAPKTSGHTAARVQSVRIACALALQVARRATKPIGLFSGDEIDDATVRRKGKISTIEEVTA